MWNCLSFAFKISNTCYQQMAVAARNAEGYGWLCPALGVMELSQNIIQVKELVSGLNISIDIVGLLLESSKSKSN